MSAQIGSLCCAGCAVIACGGQCGHQWDIQREQMLSATCEMLSWRMPCPLTLLRIVRSCNELAVFNSIQFNPIPPIEQPRFQSRSIMFTLPSVGSNSGRMASVNEAIGLKIHPDWNPDQFTFGLF